jgi:tripartite-type tricarboxylate transporter receptor subunit TctC
LIVKAAQRPEIAARILATGQEPTGANEEAFGKRVARDRQTWAKAIADFNITLD